MAQINTDDLAFFARIFVMTFFVILWAGITAKNIRKKPPGYRIVVFDIDGNMITIQGIRTRFHNYDVAWSFAQFYKELFVLYNFGVVSEDESAKLTLVRYI